jgi:hypothetical protein
VIDELYDILRQVQRAAGQQFSGIGLLVCDVPEQLPIVPLRLTNDLPTSKSLVDALASISVLESEYHDGFHVVSSDWRLIRVAQYFSPPIVADAQIDRRKLFGGRYLAALYGSALPVVQLSGIASKGFGIAIFQSGFERHFEADA